MLWLFRSNFLLFHRVRATWSFILPDLLNRFNVLNDHLVNVRELYLALLLDTETIRSRLVLNRIATEFYFGLWYEIFKLLPL